MNMTEIEARGKIKYRIANEMRKAGENKEEYEYLEIALQALKEIREYREIGTVEEFHKLKTLFGDENVEVSEITTKILKEYPKYKSIGTVEELQALKEKNTPMELAEHNFQDEVHHYLCPSCRNIVSFNQNYCEECGQALEN